MILAAALLASLLDFGSERPLARPGAPALAPCTRDTARVATHDLGSLVVWTDLRTGSPTVRAARLDRDGTLLDPFGFLVASGANAGDVAWTGSAYLVAYTANDVVSVRTVSPDAVVGDAVTVLGTEGIRFPFVRMESDGTTALLVASNGRGAVLSLDGSVRRTFTLATSIPSDPSFDIAVARDGYGVAYTAPFGATFCRIRAEDEDPQQILSEFHATNVAIGSDGEDFLIVFRMLIEDRLQALRVGDASPKFVTDVAASNPAIVRRGGDYLVTFRRDGDQAAGAVRVSSGGDRVGAATVFSPAWQPVDLDARSDGIGIAAWVRGQTFLEVASFDSADAAPSDARTISFSTPAQGSVHVAAQGSAIIAMYGESTGGASQVRLQRGIGGPSVLVAAGGFPLDVVIDGDVVWAVWYTRNEEALVRRYTTALVPIDAEPLHIYTAPAVDFSIDYSARVAAGGGALLLVAQQPPHTGPSGIHARIVREVNGVLTLDAQFLRTLYRSMRPTAVWNGSEFVVAWARSQSEWWWELPIAEDLVVQRLGVDAEPVVVPTEWSVSFNAIELARVNDDVVVAWQTSPPGTSFLRKTWAARLSSPEPHLIENPDRRTLAAIAGLGEQILMLWTKGDDVESVLLSAELAEIERDAPPIPWGFDLAVIGAKPLFAYPRVSPEDGDVFRAFVRTPFARRRAASH